jgi:hypothetical protein
MVPAGRLVSMVSAASTMPVIYNTSMQAQDIES